MKTPKLNQASKIPQWGETKPANLPMPVQIQSALAAEAATNRRVEKEAADLAASQAATDATFQARAKAMNSNMDGIMNKIARNQTALNKRMKSGNI